MRHTSAPLSDSCMIGWSPFVQLRYHYDAAAINASGATLLLVFNVVGMLAATWSLLIGQSRGAPANRLALFWL